MPNRSKLLPCLRLLSIAAAGLIATGQGAVASLPAPRARWRSAPRGTDGKAYNFTYKIK